MDYGLVALPTLKTAECLIIGLFNDGDFPDFVKTLDEQQNNLITRLFKKLNEQGDSIWQGDLDGHSLMLLHCGKKAEFDIKNLNKRLSDIATALAKQHIQSATLCVPQTMHRSAHWQVQHMLLQLDAEFYQLGEFKSKNNNPRALQSIQFYLPHAENSAIQTAEAIAAGIAFTRRLADLPANVCTPTYLAERAQDLAKQHPHLTCKILGLKELQKIGMGAFLAVAQGSVEPPRFIEMHYLGGKKETPPIVLVGKGITFDSGGISIKPADVMYEMKYDMAGAASILGLLKICATLKLPINVIGLIASAENMPSGSAVKPGDIVTSLSGQTIEILNTDAEGRLILADALTYAERFNPRFVVDLATLTGAIIVALGDVNTGLMTTDDDLAFQLLTASEESHDKAWRMPLDADYQDALDSPLADLMNVSYNRAAGSTIAACFLSRFTQKYRWAHLDIAGTAWISGKKRVATGRPIPLLIQWLQNVAHSR